jgi:hypothetical protein
MNRRLFVPLAVLLVALSLLLGGCMKDPVYADIEAFDRYGATAFRDSVSNGIEQRLLAAKTNEERIAILDEWIAMMDKNVSAVGAYKATTPEFGKIHKGLHEGLVITLDGAKQMRAALAANNSMMMDNAAIRVTQGNSRLVEEMTALRRLAAEKGYPLKE